MSAEMQFMCTFFPTQAASSKTEQKITMPALAERIRRQHAPAKAELPWLKLGFFGDKRTDKNCLRSNANLRWVSGCEFDYDLEKISFDDAVETLEQAGVQSVIYTSASHAQAKPRWRVLCPFSLGRQPDQRNKYLARLNGLLGGVASNESWTLSQAFYYGSVGNSPSHRVAETYGFCIDQLDELDAGAIGKTAGPREFGYVGGEAGPDAITDAELIRQVVTCEVLHPAMCSLAARFIGRGMPAHTVAEQLRGFMLATTEASRDERWYHRYGQIPSLVQSASAKFEDSQKLPWKNIARITHRMVQLRQPSAAIMEVVTEAAGRSGIDAHAALRLAGRICAEAAEKSYAR